MSKFIINGEPPINKFIYQFINKLPEVNNVDFLKLKNNQNFIPIKAYDEKEIFFKCNDCDNIICKNGKNIEDENFCYECYPQKNRRKNILDYYFLGKKIDRKINYLGVLIDDILYPYKIPSSISSKCYWKCKNKG